MKIRLLGLMAAIACSGAMAAEIDMTAATGALDTYSRCVGHAVAGYASSNATPAEVADAAHGACIAEFGAYQSAVRAAFLTPVHTAQAMRDADALVADRRDAVHAQAMAVVLDLRANGNASRDR